MLRALILAVVTLGLGGFLFLVLWDPPPPTRTVEIAVPEEQLPR